MHEITSRGGETMSEDLITPENLSKELLKSVFDAAYMETSYDDDGDLRVKEDVRCWVLLPGEKRDRIHLLTIFGLKPEASRQQRLELANEINKEYVVVRAFINSSDSLSLTYDFLLEGGITKKALVLGVKRFCGIPRLAINELDRDDIVK